MASHNAGKLREFAELMAPFGFEAKSAKEFGLPEPDETGTTFEENAYIKAHAAANATGLPALSDDSGLCADALDGAARRLHRELGRDAGRQARFRHRHAEGRGSLAAKSARSSPTQRTGRFVAVICLAGRTAMPNISAARPKARLSGRRAATSASATIRSSCPTATKERSAR